MENQEEKKPNPPKDGSYIIMGPTVFDELSTYTYSIVPANAVGYFWIVEGGSVMSGQMTDTVTIQWTGTMGVITANVISDIVVLDTSLGGKHHNGDE